MLENGRSRGSTGDRWLAASLASFGASFGAALLLGRWRKPPTPSIERRMQNAGSGRGDPVGGVSAAAAASGFETTDANVRTLVIVMVVSLTIMIGGVATVFTLFAHFDRGFQAGNKDLTAQQRAPVVPPLPHLQAAPYRDINAALLEQYQRLTSYGWNNAGHTSAHIPIARAMAGVVGHSLDASPTADQQDGPVAGVVLPAENAADRGLEALQAQQKPADRMQGEGRPGAVAPSAGPVEMPGGIKP